MTSKFPVISRWFSVLYVVLRALSKGLGCAARAVLRGLGEFLLISGSYPSLTRDPGIAAFRLLEGHPRRSRPFRESAVTSGLANTPHLQFGAFW